jgi:phosphoglycerol transferase MdoB-like AlkP superfamily enzyme
MSYRHPTSGHWIHLTPDDLFAEYAILTALLPSYVSLWVFNLVARFYVSLSVDLQDLLLADATYMPPNLAALTSRSAQLAALGTLRVAAVRHHTLIRAQEKLITRTLARRFKPSPTALSAPATVLPPPTAACYL